MRSWRSSPKNTGVRSLGGRASKKGRPDGAAPTSCALWLHPRYRLAVEAGYGKLSGLALRRADPKGLG